MLQKAPPTWGVMLGVGPAMIAGNSRAYDAWVVKSGGKQSNADVGIALELTVVRASYDFGLYVADVHDLEVWNFFVGRQVIQRGHFYDFLHLGFGEQALTNKNVVPYGYVPTADEAGKNMKLTYQHFTMSLASESIFTFHNKRGQCPFYWGLDLQAGYMPGDGSWRYGYREGYSGKYSHGSYHSRPVAGAPTFGHTVFSASLVFGVGGPKVGHQRVRG